jgi:hypothetical protein
MRVLPYLDRLELCIAEGIANIQCRETLHGRSSAQGLHTAHIIS